MIVKILELIPTPLVNIIPVSGSASYGAEPTPDNVDTIEL